MSAWLGGILACGSSSSAPSNDDGTTNDVSSGSESPGSTDPSTSSAANSDTTAAESSLDSTSTTDSSVDCSGYYPPCPDSCIAVTAYASDDWECVGTDNLDLCVPPGTDLAPNYASAWWTEIDGQSWVLMSGHTCRAQLDQVPTGWAECTGDADEPSACACLCHQGECTGDIDADLIADCPAEMVCPVASAWVKGGIPPEMQCVFEGLRDRVPGSYEVTFSRGNNTTEMHLLVDSDGGVQVGRYVQDTIACPSPLNGHWRPFRKCQLASADVFAQCTAVEPTEPIPAACEANPLTLAPWLEDCVDQRLACE